VTGTTRIVAMRDDDPDEPTMIRRYGVMGNALYGRFLICAREPSRSGHMQHVRIKASRDVVVVREWR
jgi:hypothetical protein